MPQFEHTIKRELHTLFIKNVRNIREASLTFGEGHNLFIGPNGHGKTNFLEAISLASSLKPMQALHNTDLITHNEQHGKIIATYGADHWRVDVDIMPQGKKAKVNEQAIRSSNDLVNALPLVSFIPAELNMVTGAQSLRRRALDYVAASLNADHVVTLKAYDKLLQNRNQLLKEWPRNPAVIASFTDLLVQEGARVMFQRLQAQHGIAELFSSMLKNILGDVDGKISYWCRDQELTHHTLNDLHALLINERDRVHPVEQRRGITMFGPHLDDINFYLNGLDAKTHASRGQTRAIVIALKLAHMLAINQLRGAAPVIILDDIVSELDHDVKCNLINTINSINAQVFFSTTDLATFGHPHHEARVFNVKNGMIS